MSQPRILLFAEKQPPARPERLAGLPDEGFVWIDFVREEAAEWADAVQALAGISVHPAHVVDSLNPAHPCFFDATEEYDMLIFRGLVPDAAVLRSDTRPTTFFIADRLLVTVRPRDSVSVSAIERKLVDRSVRIPRRPAGLLHLILSAMVDRFMALREPLSRQLEEWQASLLDPQDPFDDWMTLMRHRNSLRHLGTLCEEQLDAVTAWRDSMPSDLDDFLRVRVHDLMEHVQRVLQHVQHVQEEIDSLVQIHFAAVAHRTNDIMRVLTVTAAIFLPLTLVAGIFGMNFEHMPELKLPYAYFVTLGLMIGLGVGMVLVFRKKKWI